jgi:hypothetical protein
MPWTQEKPFIIELFEFGSDKPRDLFYATREELETQFDRYKMAGIYQRIWSGHGKSAEQDGWNTLKEWSAD